VPQPVPEATLWSYLSQLAVALRAVHLCGLGARCVSPVHVLVTSGSRVRLGGIGVADVLEYDQVATLPFRAAFFFLLRPLPSFLSPTRMPGFINTIITIITIIIIIIIIIIITPHHHHQSHRRRHFLAFCSKKKRQHRQRSCSWPQVKSVAEQQRDDLVGLGYALLTVASRTVAGPGTVSACLGEASRHYSARLVGVLSALAFKPPPPPAAPGAPPPSPPDVTELCAAMASHFADELTMTCVRGVPRGVS